MMASENADQRPPAPGDYERNAAEMFPVAMSPEEYAARHGHGWMCFSFDEYRYADPSLDAWIRRLGDILFGRNGAPTVTELRHSLLNDGERARIEQEIRAMHEDP
jgi:hypothetical protein